MCIRDRRAAAEAIAADPMHRAAEVHGDIIPIGELLGDTATTEIYTLHIVGSVRCV